jgi:hypothetical protein
LKFRFRVVAAFFDSAQYTTICSRLSGAMMTASSKIFLSPETKRRLVEERTGGVVSTTPRSSFYSQPTADSSAHYKSMMKRQLEHSASKIHSSSPSIPNSVVHAATPSTAFRELRHDRHTPPSSSNISGDVEFFRSQAEEYKAVSVKYREVIGILTKKIEGLQTQITPLPQQHTCTPLATGITPERVLFGNANIGSQFSDWRHWEIASHELVSAMSDQALDLSLRKAEVFDASRNAAMSQTVRTLQSVQDECLQLANELELWSPNREW